MIIFSIATIAMHRSSHAARTIKVNRLSMKSTSSTSQVDISSVQYANFDFVIGKSDSKSKARLSTITTPHGNQFTQLYKRYLTILSRKRACRMSEFCVLRYKSSNEGSNNSSATRRRNADHLIQYLPSHAHSWLANSRETWRFAKVYQLEWSDAHRLWWLPNI